MSLKNSRFLRLIFYIILIILILNKNLIFEPWGQIKYYSTFSSAYDWFDSRNFIKIFPHLPRFSIIYPCYLINNIFNISVSLSYGFYVISILCVASIIWHKIAEYSFNSKNWPFLCSLIPLSLVFVINGRYAFCLLGISLIIYKAYYRKYEHPTNNNFLIEFLGLYLSTVSSGTFFFGLFFFIIINYRKIIKTFIYQLRILFLLNFNKNNNFKNIFEIFNILFLIFLFLLFVLKNFEYYGGLNINGLNGLLSHGIISIFKKEILINECLMSKSSLCDLIYILNSNEILHISLLVFSLILIYISLEILKNNNLNYFAKLTFILSVIAGFFGFTAFLSILIIIPQIRISSFNTTKLKSY